MATDARTITDAQVVIRNTRSSGRKTPMSRDERQARSDPASGTGSARRGLGFDSAPEAESIRFGCSMLSQIRMRPRNPRALVPMRCSLGFALHSPDEVRKCMGVEGPAECWKSVQNWRVPTTDVTTPHVTETQVPARVAAETVPDRATQAANGRVVAEVLIAKSVEVEIVAFVPAPTGTDQGDTD